MIAAVVDGCDASEYDVLVRLTVIIIASGGIDLLPLGRHRLVSVNLE